MLFFFSRTLFIVVIYFLLNHLLFYVCVVFDRSGFYGSYMIGEYEAHTQGGNKK